MHRMVLLFTIIAMPLQAQMGPRAPRNRHFSPNKKFSAEVSTATRDKPLLTVYNHDTENVTQVWSRPLAENAADSKRNPLPPAYFIFQNIEAIVADDGSAVALYPPHNFGSRNFALRIVTRNGDDRSFWMNQISENLDDVGISSQFGVATSFQLFLGSQNPAIFGLWHPHSKQWVVIGLDDFTIKKPTAALKDELDAAALSRAREMIKANTPTPIKKMLRPIFEFAAGYIPGVNPGPRNQYLTQQMQAAYRFVGHHRKSEDKKLIQALMDGELTMTTSSDGSDENDSRSVTVGLYSQNRSLGDELLSAWDGKYEESAGWGFNPYQKGNHFVSLSGIVKLPFSAPTNSHAVMVFLIPNHVNGNDWSSKDEVLRLQFNPNSGMFGSNDDKPFDQLGFSFNNILAGEYRLKAVWDRRPPFAVLPNGPEEPVVGVLTPGDYESADSKPFRLAAGEHAEDIVLECTNRVGDAENYFAADEIWKKRNPPISSLSVPVKLHYERSQKVLLDRQVSDWLVRTNFHAPGVHIEKVQLISHPYATTDSSRRALSVTVRTPKIDRGLPSPPVVQAKLRDEHGCEFQSYGASFFGSARRFYFTHVPFGAREFHIELMQLSFGRFDDGPPDRRETKLISVVLTNLCGIKPESWTPETLPAKREWDDLKVELATVDTSAYEGDDEYFLPQHPHHRENGVYPNRGWKPNRFNFSAAGQAAVGWQRISGRFKDRWGNEARSLNAFCREETIFKYEALFGRDPSTGKFDSSEKFEVSVPKFPAAGESITIDQVHFLRETPIHMYSLSGTGEFYYRNGFPVHGEKEIPAPDPAFHQPDQSIQSLSVTDKLYQSKTMPNGTLIPERSLVVAARGPHLSYRAPILPRERILLVAEQDRSMSDPINSPEIHSAHYTGNGPREWRLIPLALPSAEGMAKLTFTIQKPRIAEFIIHVPQRPPSN